MSKFKVPRPTAHRQDRPPKPFVTEQAKLPKPTSDDPKLWAFSFRYWRQIEFFGLDHSEPKWFVSMLEKLAELSKESIDAFLADGAKRHSWRYHEIDWSQHNIPIERKELTWLKSDYIENDTEYPLFQFQISQALGRIVGFWDENDVFNIILLDPLHNIQPSKYFNYKVDPCSPLPCKYTSLLRDLDRTKEMDCVLPECPVNVALQSVPGDDHCYEVVILRIDDELSETVRNLIEGGSASSIEELLEYGATFFDKKGPKDLERNNLYNFLLPRLMSAGSMV